MFNSVSIYVNAGVIGVFRNFREYKGKYALEGRYEDPQDVTHRWNNITQFF